MGSKVAFGGWVFRGRVSAKEGFERKEITIRNETAKRFMVFPEKG
jgi:hypothetical protein